MHPIEPYEPFQHFSVMDEEEEEKEEEEEEEKEEDGGERIRRNKPLQSSILGSGVKPGLFVGVS
jgi:hypothetical protein